MTFCCIHFHDEANQLAAFSVWAVQLDKALPSNLIHCCSVAAQQQAAAKPATAIAAVGPFDHTPLDKPAPQSPPSDLDIKFVERNGGSGQSSPSISGEWQEWEKLSWVLALT